MDIVKEIGMPAMLGQLAEECCELGKAALKMQRILEGKNPTPITYEEAKLDLMEEATDVGDCPNLLVGGGFLVYDYAQSKQKMKRWRDRIRVMKEAREGAANEP